MWFLLLSQDGRGDVYLSVECASNPAMMTAVAEDRQGKAIQGSMEGGGCDYAL